MKSAHPCQKQSVLTTAEAAKLFGRSASWVRDQINTGRLHTLHPYGVRPYLVTEASANVLKARLDERAAGAVKPRLQVIAGRTGAPPVASSDTRGRSRTAINRLHLVIDNTCIATS